VDSRIVSFCDRWNATHPWEHNARYHRRVLRQLPGAPERGLAVGCGTGDRVRRLAVRRSWAHGVDQNGTVVQRARELSPDATGLTYTVDDVMALRSLVTMTRSRV
jgi:ubiquinone/menaquinone biosynthesis C-methylase UbiE